jgi:hypothetical protein
MLGVTVAVTKLDRLSRSTLDFAVVATAQKQTGR